MSGIIHVSTDNRVEIKRYIKEGAKFTHDPKQYADLMQKSELRRTQVMNVRSAINSIGSFFKFIACRWSDEDHERQKWYKEERRAITHERLQAKGLEQTAASCEMAAKENRKKRLKSAGVYAEALRIPTISLRYPLQERAQHIDKE